MRVLVTGAFGNIGRHALPLLLRRGHVVRALSYEWRRDKRWATAALDVMHADVRDRALMDRAVRDVDCIVHLAYVIPPVAHEQRDLAESVNIHGTRTVLEAARAATKAPRILFASTLDVYGVTGHLAPPRRVGDPIAVTDNYSAHKIACEAMVQESGLTWTIFRFADVPPIEVRRPHPIMFEIPTATRIEMIHPRDAGLAVLNGIESDTAWGRIWNIGGGLRCQLTYGEYLGAFLDAMGIGPLPREAFSDKPYCTDWLDTEESQRLFRYQHHSFDDVVRETAALLGWRRPLAKLFRPIVRAAILRMSPRWRYRSP